MTKLVCWEFIDFTNNYILQNRKIWIVLIMLLRWNLYIKMQHSYILEKHKTLTHLKLINIINIITSIINKYLMNIKNGKSLILSSSCFNMCFGKSTVSKFYTPPKNTCWTTTDWIKCSLKQIYGIQINAWKCIKKLFPLKDHLWYKIMMVQSRLTDHLKSKVWKLLYVFSYHLLRISHIVLQRTLKHTTATSWGNSLSTRDGPNTPCLASARTL